MNQPEYTFVPPNPDKTLEWITVLAAAGLDYRLSKTDQGWLLHVPLDQSAKARDEINACEHESVSIAEPTTTVTEDRRAAWIAFWFAHLFVLFYVWWGPFVSTEPRHMAGSAHAERILNGEWWRALTALTLHSGIPHLAGNALFIALVGPAVLSAFGAGVGLALMLAGGLLGNVMSAATADPGHIAIGASTMAFAALGAISAQRTIAAYRQAALHQPVRPRVWLPLVSGFALLAFMGAAPHTDIGGHIFGFLAGALLAVPVYALDPARMPAALQQSLTAAMFAVPVMAWLIALRYA